MSVNMQSVFIVDLIIKGCMHGYYNIIAQLIICNVGIQKIYSGREVL